MKSLKLISLAILILSANIVTINAQENDLEVLEANKKLFEMSKFGLQGWEYNNGKISKEQEEKILIKLPPEAKSKMEEIKKLDEVKYYRLLNSFNFGYFLNLTNPSVSYSFSSAANKDLKNEKLLEIDVQLLALKYKNADAASKSKIKKDLTATLSDLFDIREAEKQKEVKQLETRLQELNKSLKTRKQNKDIIIERRIQELFGDSKYLEW